MEGCSVLPLQLRFVPCGIGGACGGAWIGCAAAKPLLVGGGTGLLAGSRASLRSSVHSDRATMLHAPRLPPPPPPPANPPGGEARLEAGQAAPRRARPCNAAVLIAMLRSRPGGQQQLRKAPRSTLSSHLLLASHAPCTWCSPEQQPGPVSSSSSVAAALLLLIRLPALAVARTPSRHCPFDLPHFTSHFTSSNSLHIVASMCSIAFRC